jgi:hypothetical protein
MVAAMLISNSWLKARGTIPLKRKLFQQSGCKRCAGIFGATGRVLIPVTSPVISFDARMLKNTAYGGRSSAGVKAGRSGAGQEIGRP